MAAPALPLDGLAAFEVTTLPVLSFHLDRSLLRYRVQHVTPTTEQVLQGTR